MGNQQMYGRRAQEAEVYGSVYLDLNADAFGAGDQVNATVFVNIKQRYPGDKLCLKVKGREHTRWIDLINHSKEKPDGTFENWTEKVVREEELIHVKQEILIYDWANNTVLNPGQFSFPVSFKIPQGLPGSFFMAQGETAAEIRYGIEAFIKPENPSMPKIKHKREITIREPVQSVIQTREVAITKNVKTGCCCCTTNQGIVSVKSRFEKDAYTPLEKCNVQIDADNSQCKARIGNVTFDLRQTISLKAQQYSKGFNYNVSSVSLGAIEPGQAFVGDQRKYASIQLPGMQMGGTKDFKANNGAAQNFSYNPTSSIAPSTNGRLIRSNYNLDVVCYMEGCLCCDTNPSNSLPIQIYALIQKPVEKPPTPPNWRPTVMPPANITINISNVSNGGNNAQNIQISMGGNNGMANNNMPNQQQNMNINISNTNNTPAPAPVQQQQQQQQQPQYPPQQQQQQQQQQQPQYPPQQQQQQQQPPSGYQQPPPSGYQQPPPSGYQQPPPSGYQQPPPSGYQQPPPSGYQQPPPSGYQQPPPSGYQQPPPSGYQQPPPSGYQQPPPSGYQQQPPSGYQQLPPSGYQQPPPSGYQQPQPGFQQ